MTTQRLRLALCRLPLVLLAFVVASSFAEGRKQRARDLELKLKELAHLKELQQQRYRAEAARREELFHIVDFVSSHGMYCTPDFENSLVHVRLEYTSPRGTGYDMIEVANMSEARYQMGY